MSVARSTLALAAVALLTACERAAPAGPVRTAEDATRRAERALDQAHLDEEVSGVDREGDAWIVTSRWRESSVAGHLLTVDAATGKVTMERYRSVELGGPRSGSGAPAPILP
jgi:hypothetical protein